MTLLVLLSREKRDYLSHELRKKTNVLRYFCNCHCGSRVIPDLVCCVRERDSSIFFLVRVSNSLWWEWGASFFLLCKSLCIKQNWHCSYFSLLLYWRLCFMYSLMWQVDFALSPRPPEPFFLPAWGKVRGSVSLTWKCCIIILTVDRRPVVY